jgi:hypothetical protein
MCFYAVDLTGYALARKELFLDEAGSAQQRTRISGRRRLAGDELRDPGAEPATVARLRTGDLEAGRRWLQRQGGAGGFDSCPVPIMPIVANILRGSMGDPAASKPDGDGI